MKISFLCFDLSGNSLGRVVLLADALSKHYDVELLGPAKKEGIWPPMKHTRHPVKLFPWARYPRFVSTVKEILNEIRGDVIFACKARPTSLGIGLLKKRQSGAPLLLDIDDWELGFFYHSGFWGKMGRFLNFSNPNGLPYTWLMEQFVSQADEITVSNRFLQKRFGGELVYHCRDTSCLSPENFDSMESKRNLGLGQKKIIMFLGTPRDHKGVDDLICAMDYCHDPNIHLAIIGAEGKNVITGKKNISIFPKRSFSQLGETLAAADILVVPQRDTSDTVGQMPAKIFDAMAMQKPIISTPVSDIPEVLSDCGYLFQPGNVQHLASTINYVIEHEEEARKKAEKARKRCVELYDIKRAEEKLVALVEGVKRKGFKK